MPSINQEETLNDQLFIESTINEGLKSWPDAVDSEGIQKECNFIKEFIADKSLDFFSIEKRMKRVVAFGILARLYNTKTDQLKGREFIDALMATKPGWSENLIDMINDEVQSSLAVGPRYCSAIHGYVHKKCFECKHFQKIKSPIKIQTDLFPATEATGFYEASFGKNGKFRQGKPCYTDLLKKFKQSHIFISIIDSGNIYLYKSNYWAQINELLIKEFAESNFRPNPSESMRNEFLNLVRVSNLKERDWFNTSTDGLINLQNGVFDIEKNQLRPHSPEYGFQYILPYSYDPKAQAPTFLKFINDVTKHDLNLQEIILEFMGHALAGTPCSLGEHALFLYGPSASNGKSTMMDVMKAMVGKDNYSSMTLDALNKDTKRYALEGKLFNVSEETNVKSLVESDIFKTMVTGGELDVKQLYVQDYTIKNKAKLIILCNDLPKSGDRSDGLYRRVLLVPMLNKFSDDIGNRDPFMRDKLINEMPGIFNLCLQGYRRFKEQNFKFTHSEISKAALDEYKKENDNVLQWYAECVQLSDNQDDVVSKDDLYRSYVSFAEEGNLYVLNKNHFFRQLKMIREFKESQKLTPPSFKKQRVINGIILIAN